MCLLMEIICVHSFYQKFSLYTKYFSTVKLLSPFRVNENQMSLSSYGIAKMMNCCVQMMEISLDWNMKTTCFDDQDIHH